MKTLKLCSNCGSYELVSFDYDPDRGGVPRLFGYVNDNVIDMDYNEEEERFGFWLDGVYCRKCNTLDDVFYWEVDNFFNGTVTGKVLTERDSKFVNINKDLVRTLKQGDKEEKQEFIKNLSKNIVDIIKEFDVKDIYTKLKYIEEVSNVTIKYKNEDNLNEFLKWVKKLIQKLIKTEDNETIVKHEEEEDE